MSPTLGLKLSPDLPFDLKALLETRLLVVANSGGGKSHLLRKLLEETHGKVQQIVIDPEGEYSTLREKFDYVICAPQGGDAVADPNTAALLATRLLELGVSAILNIYELTAPDRQKFVRRFLEALVNARKELWRPVLVVLDEAHVFCPEVGKAEASAAVIDLATRGRKRGFCLAMATQRLSKLNKDAAAEMLNKAVGRTGLDIDLKRSADELGIPGKDAAARLRGLPPGEFYVYGPAFSQEVTKHKIGAVHTSHAKTVGQEPAAPPAPSAKIRAVLAKGLQDIPKEAAAEARTVEELKAELVQVRGALAKAHKPGGLAGVPEAEVKERIAVAVQEARGKAANAGAAISRYAAAVAAARLFLRKAGDALELDVLAGEKATQGHVYVNIAPSGEVSLRPPVRKGDVLVKTPAPRGAHPLRSGAVGILKELAACMPAGYSHAQVATLTRFSPKGGTFKTYIGDLKRGGYIDVRDGMVYATKTGVESLGGQVPAAPTSHAEVMSLWRGALRKGAFSMLEVIVENPQGISKDDLARDSRVDMEANGGTFKTYLGDLRRNGLIEIWNMLCHPSSILQPGTGGKKAP